MKNIKLALCDQDNDYITGLASYILNRYKEVNIHIFTAPESFFSDEGEYDVALMSEDFEEISSFKKTGFIRKKYYLSEDVNEDENSSHIYKYQAVDNILFKISELKQFPDNKKANATNKRTKSKFIGVISPVSHELQLPFSMALSESLQDNGNVLFLDLEEISIMPQLIGEEKNKNIMDLIYDLSDENQTLGTEDYIRQFLGINYISPFYNPNELGEIDAATWRKVFKHLDALGYDYVVILFGRTIQGFVDIIDRFDELIVLSKPGDFYKKWQKVFMEFIDRAGTQLQIKDVLLPMSAGNLTEGTYCIEELLQGNLGAFVRKLRQNQTEIKVAV